MEFYLAVTVLVIVFVFAVIPLLGYFLLDGGASYAEAIKAGVVCTLAMGLVFGCLAVVAWALSVVFS